VVRAGVAWFAIPCSSWVFMQLGFKIYRTPSVYQISGLIYLFTVYVSDCNMSAKVARVYEEACAEAKRLDQDEIYQ
jgi:hypothetical protein